MERGVLLTIERPWFPINKLLAYNRQQNTAVVGVKAWELRKYIAEYQSPSILPLMDNFEDNKLSLVLHSLNPVWAKDIT